MLNACKRKLPFKQSTVQGENVFELKRGKMLNEDFFPVNYDWLVLLEWDLVVKCYWLSACDTCSFIFIGCLTVCFGMFYYKLLAVVWVKLDDFFPINSIASLS